MRPYHKTFLSRTHRICATVFMAVSVCTQTYANSNVQNCYNREYRAKNPNKCSFLTKSAPILGGAAVLGGAAALVTLASGANNNSAPGAQSAPMPTISVRYDMVGADIDNAHLASITESYSYNKNYNQYNDIRLAYSLARGYTGRGTTIAILDSGLDYWHGATVAKIASGDIAPNANIESYKVSENSYKFLSYGEIGNVIASAQSANVYNASWSVPMRATDIHSRAQLENLTDANFINQISIAATQRDAIFVWAAGNDGDINSSALSALPRVMNEMNGHFVNVVAWDSNIGALAEYSNACGITQDYCITAPGTNISVDAADPNGVSGTSFAAPIVSGAIAVIREAYPYMNAEQITDLLFTTARDIGAPGVDPIYGHGMLDMERATRPVGTELIPMGDTTMQRLTTARIAAPIAHKIKSANIQFAFFDTYGRPFNTSMSKNIRSITPSRGFEHLRGNTDVKTTLGPIELGFGNQEFLLGDGFLKLQKNTTRNFVGFYGDTNLGNFHLFSNARLTMTNAQTTPESFVSAISTIYQATVKFGIRYQDWTFSATIPDAIVSGNMTLRTPRARLANGAITYNDTTIDMVTHPATEYSIGYKMLSATFINNPYGTNEFFVVARGKLQF